MFNNNYNGNSPPPNYYPNDNVFYNETTNQTNNFNIEKLLPILSGNINPLELLKSYSNSNPQLSQILGLLTSLQKPAKNKKKATTQSSSCQYVLVKDYYAKKELED